MQFVRVVKHTSRKIYPFSPRSRKFSGITSPPPPSVSRALSSFQTKTLYPLNNSPFPSPSQPLATTLLFPVSMNLTTPGPSCKWNHTVFVLLCLAFFFFFWPHRMARGIQFPQPGIKPAPPALEGQSLNHWTSREVPCVWLIFKSSFAIENINLTLS